MRIFGTPKQRGGAILAAVILSGIVIPSAAAGPFKEGYYADSAYHTFLYPDMQFSAANRDWDPWVDHTRSTDYDPTDINTARVSYHYNSSYYYPYVDVSWWTANISAPGGAWCDKVFSGSKCDHWHVNFDVDITGDSTQEYVACQEVGHTLGLGHNNDSDSTVEHGSCLANDEDSYQPHPSGGDRFHLWQHDINHLNAGY